MESISSIRAAPLLLPLHYPPPTPRPFILNLTSQPKHPPRRAPAASRSPRGFGPPPPKTTRQKKKKRTTGSEDDEDDDERGGEEEDDDDETIPEVVTNRMMRRVGLSVGVPLTAGLLFFPFFYYLKVAAKIDVPNWVPFIVSFFFFGTALLGISYGIVSASWDPLREGSLLGWKEARRNWPMFWQSLRGGGGSRK